MKREPSTPNRTQNHTLHTFEDFRQQSLKTNHHGGHENGISNGNGLLSPNTPGAGGRRGSGDSGKGKGKRRASGSGEDEAIEKNPVGESLLLSLPPDLLPQILAHIPPRSLLPTRLIATAFNNTLDKDSIWRESFVNRFVGVRSIEESDNENGVDAAAPARVETAGNVLGAGIGQEGKLGGIVRSCIGNGSGGNGWKKEALARETMLERWLYSKAQIVVHNPQIDLLSSLSLFYTPSTQSSNKPGSASPNPYLTPKGKGTSSPLSPLSPSPSPSSPTPNPTAARVGPKILGAKSRQPHRLEIAEKSASQGGRAPHILSVSQNAGVAIRGDPLLGKSLPGYLGAGQISALERQDRVITSTYCHPLNPNSLVWGLRSGLVIHSTLLNPLPSPGRLTGNTVVCEFSDGHLLPVRAVYTTPPPSSTQGITINPALNWFVSGGDDALVKVWKLGPVGDRRPTGPPGPNQLTPGKIKLLWTSAPLLKSLETPSTVYAEERPNGTIDPVICVRCLPRQGVLVAATENGRIWVWQGIGGDVGQVVSKRVWDGIPGETQATHMVVVAREVDGEELRERKELLEILIHGQGDSIFRKITCRIALSGGEDDWDREVEPPSIEEIQVTTFSTGTGTGLACVHSELEIPPLISLPTSLIPADFAARISTTSAPSTPGPSGLDTSESLPSGISTPIRISRADEALSRASSKGLGEGRFVVAGGEDGLIYLWDWVGEATVDVATKAEVSEEAKSVEVSVKPMLKWIAAEGPVTAVTAAKGIIASGSFDGLVKVWDPLTSPPTVLRTLRNRHANAPSAYPDLYTHGSQLHAVNHIILESDMLVANIGQSILGWRAGATRNKTGGKAWKGQTLGKHAAGKVSPAKGYNIHEFKEDVVESRLEIEEEQSLIRAGNEQERAIRAEYETIGFENSDEAIQYALMISREDDELQRALRASEAESGGETSGYVSRGSGSGSAGGPGGETDFEDDDLAEVLEQIRLQELREQQELNGGAGSSREV